MVPIRWLFIGYWVAAAVINGSIAKGPEAAARPNKRLDKLETTLETSFIKESSDKTMVKKSSNLVLPGSSDIAPQPSKNTKLEPDQQSVRTTRFNKREVREESFPLKIFGQNTPDEQKTRHNSFLPRTNYYANGHEDKEKDLSSITRNEEGGNRNIEKYFPTDKYAQTSEGGENFGSELNGIGALLSASTQGDTLPSSAPLNPQNNVQLEDALYESGNIASNENGIFGEDFDSGENVGEFSQLSLPKNYEDYKNQYFPLNLRKPIYFDENDLKIFQGDDSGYSSSSDNQFDDTKTYNNIFEAYVPKLIKKYFRSNSQLDSWKKSNDWVGDNELKFLSAYEPEQEISVLAPAEDDRENLNQNERLVCASGGEADTSDDASVFLGGQDYVRSEIRRPVQEKEQSVEDDCQEDDQETDSAVTTSALQDLYDDGHGKSQRGGDATAPQADRDRTQAMRYPRGWSPRMGKSKKLYEDVQENGRMKRSPEDDLRQMGYSTDVQAGPASSTWSATPAKDAVDSDALVTFIDDLVDESEIESGSPWQSILYRFLLSLLKKRMKEKMLHSNSNAKLISLEEASDYQQTRHLGGSDFNSPISVYTRDEFPVFPEKQSQISSNPYQRIPHEEMNARSNEKNAPLAGLGGYAKKTMRTYDGIEPPSEKRYLLGALTAPRFGYRKPFLIRNLGRDFKPRKIFPEPNPRPSVVSHPESHRQTFSPRMGKRAFGGDLMFVDSEISSGNRKFPLYLQGDTGENPKGMLQLPAQYNDMGSISFTPRVGKRVSNSSHSTEKRSLSFTPQAAKRTFFPRTGKRAPSFTPRAGKRVFSFIPRAGKRTRSVTSNSGQGSYSFVPRAGKRGYSFIPRTGKRGYSFIPRAGKRPNFSFIPRTGKRGYSFIPRAGKRGYSFIPRAGKRGYSFVPRAGKRGYSFIPRAGKRGFSFFPRAGKRSYSFIPRAGKRGYSFIPRAGKRNDD